MQHIDDREGLRGKVVLVTGSARGLGAALVRAAARRSARVVVNCRADLSAAQALALDLQRSGGEALVCRADVADYDQAAALVGETLKAFGRIDVLVNAVGTFSWKSVADTQAQEWREVVASNLDSVYHMCRLVLPCMRRQHWGRLVNLGALGAERALGPPQVSAYSSAKAGVVAFSRSLAIEEARCGFTVNVVSPPALMDDGPGSRSAPISRPRTWATACPWAGSARPRTSRGPSPSSPLRRPTSSPARCSRSPAARSCSRFRSLIGVSSATAFSPR